MAEPINTAGVEHIAIIIDGNGRWATQRGKKRTEGHIYGRKNFEYFCRELSRMGVKYFTVYGFSTENWSRPPEEVAAIVALFQSYLDGCSQLSREHNYRIRVIGSREGLPQAVIDSIEEVEAKTRDKTGMTVQIAFNYGGRNEIVRAARRIADAAAAGALTASTIDEGAFESYLDTARVPNPDIMIRTGGEIRLSNFLLWQIAYSELFFVDKFWPDFTLEDLHTILASFKGRDRRFGGVKA